MSGEERLNAKPKTDDMVEEAKKALDLVKKLQEAQLQQKETYASYESAKEKNATAVRRNEEIGTAKTSLKELFAQVYKNPEAALATFQTAGAQKGEATLLKQLTERPEAFGKLQGQAIFGFQTADRQSARELVKISGEKLIRLNTVATEKPTQENKLQTMAKERDQLLEKSNTLARQSPAQAVRDAMRDANYQISNLQPKQVNQLSPDQQNLGVAVARQVKTMDAKLLGKETGVSR